MVFIRSVNTDFMPPFIPTIEHFLVSTVKSLYMIQFTHTHACLFIEHRVIMTIHRNANVHVVRLLQRFRRMIFHSHDIVCVASRDALSIFH